MVKIAMVIVTRSSSRPLRASYSIASLSSPEALDRAISSKPSRQIDELEAGFVSALSESSGFLSGVAWAFMGIEALRGRPWLQTVDLLQAL